MGWVSPTPTTDQNVFALSKGSVASNGLYDADDRLA